LCSTPLRQSTVQAVAPGYIFRDQKKKIRSKNTKQFLAIHGSFK
jgi:hypothetical protein